MIAITTFSIQPSPTHCGLLTSMQVVVEWAGASSRKIRVCMHVPSPCTFQSEAPAKDEGATESCLTKSGVSPLSFLIQGRFACPSGTHHPMLTATAQDLSNGDRDDKDTPLTVAC
jgi:hypothetical protein